MNKNAVNDAEADASGIIPQELDADGESPNQNGTNTQALGDDASNVAPIPIRTLPASPPLPPTREMEMPVENDPPMPVPGSQPAAASEATEEGSMTESRMEILGDDDSSMPLPASQIAAAFEEMEDGKKSYAPATRSALAYAGIAAKGVPVLEGGEGDHAPVPDAQLAAFYDEGAIQDNFPPPDDPPSQDAKQPTTSPPAITQSPPADDTQRRSGENPLGTQPQTPSPNDDEDGENETNTLPNEEDGENETNAPSVPMFHDLEATPVDQDAVVYLSTPVETDLRPWWKKQRIPIAIAVGGLAIGLVVAVVATVGFGGGSVTASSQPPGTQSLLLLTSSPTLHQSPLPSLGPSHSSPPSEIPSLRPTFHPSQSAAPISIRSAPPSTSLVPSTSPSSPASAHPSVSTAPTVFCFEGAISIFTDKQPRETSWTLSRIATFGGVPWAPDAKVVLEGFPEDESSSYTYDVCLERGEYEFTIKDDQGNGICCENGAGCFELVVDGWVVLEGAEFGFNQTVSFSLPNPSLPPSRSPAPSQSLSPTLRPSASLGPSLSLRPSSLPSLLPSSPPTTYWSSLIWEQRGQTINGESPGDKSGSFVVLSGDGLTMAIGAPGVDGNDDRPGYVKTYHREDNETDWKELGKKIKGAANGDLFGRSQSIALSEDGRTLAVGGPGYFSKPDRPGYVRVYQMEGDAPDSSWKQLGQDIFGEANGDMSGISISISANGRTLAIGAMFNGQISGHVRVYVCDEADEEGDSWKQLGRDIDGESALDNSGFSVDLDSEGKTLAIGAIGNDGNGEDSGHSRVYQLGGDGRSWEQIGQDINGEAPGDYSGTLSISADGKMLAIGADYNDGNGTENSGHVRVYRIDDASQSWKQLGQDIDGEAANDYSGISVSLSADGSGATVAIGAYQNSGNGPSAGHTRVYRMEDGLSWKQLGRDIDGEGPGDESGWVVSLTSDGKTVAIGSPGNAENGESSGHVRVFDIDY